MATGTPSRPSVRHPAGDPTAWAELGEITAGRHWGAGAAMEPESARADTDRRGGFPCQTMRIHHLFVSKGHNYFGHHGQAPGEHPMTAVDRIECVAARGIRGDRFFDYKEDYKGQITFFSLEVFETLRRELGLPGAQPETTRRNVFVSGADLNQFIGREFEIQDVRFAGVEECRPCYWMNRAFGDDRTEAWLKGRGGLRARVLTSGTLYTG